MSWQSWGSHSSHSCCGCCSLLAALCEALECQPGDLLRWEAVGAADW
ncbi:helix-turn-helix domain-containing protein [Streptosporangium sp. NPDC002607]